MGYWSHRWETRASWLEDGVGHGGGKLLITNGHPMTAGMLITTATPCTTLLAAISEHPNSSYMCTEITMETLDKQDECN